MNKKNFVLYEAAKKELENGNVDKAISMLARSPKYVRMWLYGDIFEKSGINLLYNGSLRKVFLRVFDKFVFKVEPGVVELRQYVTTFDDVVDNYPSLIKMMLEKSKNW